MYLISKTLTLRPFWILHQTRSPDIDIGKMVLKIEFKKNLVPNIKHGINTLYITTWKLTFSIFSQFLKA